jgi:3-dehydroquinate dehydratase/shikimate dehydrogenase
MGQNALLAATLTTYPDSCGLPISTLPEEVSWLEVRADVVGDLAPDWLTNHFNGCRLYSIRSQVEGGNGPNTPRERRAHLLRAAQQYDLIDLEGERDLLPELLAAIPPHKRVISWHGPATNLDSLIHRFARFATVDARLYRFIPQAEQPGDSLIPLAFLHHMQRDDIVAYATGSAGFWSCIAAPYLGAPVVFGSVSVTLWSSAMPTVSQLITDYGFPTLAPLEALYGIVGDPVMHSLSPRLHNAAYRALAHPGLYVPFQAVDFKSFWHTVVTHSTLSSIGLPLQGLTVVSPHKETALEVADRHSTMVRYAGSSNLFVWHNGLWTADTTDAVGVMMSLQSTGISAAGKRVAVVGCGGAGRAAAAGLDQAGAEVTLVNRSRTRGQLATQRLGLPFIPLIQFTTDNFDMVVHATPVGRVDQVLPFDLGGLKANAAVIDFVYGAEPTPLMSRSRELGHTAIDGHHILVAQAREQFQRMTGLEMPQDLAWDILIGAAQPAEAMLADA